MTADHALCEQILRDTSAKAGTRLEITTDAPQKDHSPYPVHAFTCPHGTTYWIHPTVDQIAEWIATQTP